MKNGQNTIFVSEAAYNNLLAKIVKLEEEIFGCGSSAEYKVSLENNDNLGAIADFEKTEKGKLQDELKTSLERLNLSKIVYPNPMITGADLGDTVLLTDQYGDDLTIFISGDYESNIANDYYSLPLQAPIVEKLYGKAENEKFVVEVQHDEIKTKIEYTVKNIEKNTEIEKVKTK